MTRTRTFVFWSMTAFMFIGRVAAHGYVSSIVADGKTYVGGIPQQTFPASPIRLIDDPSPVKNLDDSAMACGPNAQPGKLVANITAGSQVTIAWATGENSHWPHNTGPILDYLAECGPRTCDEFDTQTAKWFKIQQAGRRSDGLWKQQDLFEGKTVTTTIPPNLPAGNYMLRHEILALHLAQNVGGIEVYASCIQLAVKASGEPQVDRSALAPTTVFPGAYKLTDPGIFTKNPFDTQLDYPFPGPPVADFAAAACGGKLVRRDSVGAATGIVSMISLISPIDSATQPSPSSSPVSATNATDSATLTSTLTPVTPTGTTAHTTGLSNISSSAFSRSTTDLLPGSPIATDPIGGLSELMTHSPSLMVGASTAPSPSPLPSLSSSLSSESIFAVTLSSLSSAMPVFQQPTLIPTSVQSSPTSTPILTPITTSEPNVDYKRLIAGRRTHRYHRRTMLL
jgi:hypothetical protein